MAPLSRTVVDLDFATEHPLRWLRHFWLHWVFALAVWLKAWIVTYDVFSVTTGSALWPIVLGGLGVAAAMSSLAPFDVRIQAVTGALIGSVAVMRILVYVEVILGFLSEGEGVTDRALIAAGFLTHWVVILVLGVAWPRLSWTSGSSSTVDAGREQLPPEDADQGAGGNGATA